MAIDMLMRIVVKRVMVYFYIIDNNSDNRFNDHITSTDIIMTIAVLSILAWII